MISFYPGPSKVYPQVRQYMLDAYDSGILSANHRSASFMQLCEKTVKLLHEKLHIPADYSVVFVSSATEGWEVVAQSFTARTSGHIYNGAFGQKWFEYARKIRPEAVAFQADVNQQVTAQLASLSPDFSEAEVICLTQNETSNGTQLRNEDASFLRQRFEKALLAVDVTSSLGGVVLPWEQADIWFASVQKCLGLPAGMGLLITSPRALAVAKALNDRRYYNSFLFIHQNMQTFQTHYTPNVLGIYLLSRVLEQVEPIDSIDERIRRQAAGWYAFFDAHPLLKPLITNPAVRSDTVITVTPPKEILAVVKQKAQEAGITLGNGYGEWKDTTFRIANFPAITEQEIIALKDVLTVISV